LKLHTSLKLGEISLYYKTIDKLAYFHPPQLLDDDDTKTFPDCS